VSIDGVKHLSLFGSLESLGDLLSYLPLGNILQIISYWKFCNKFPEIAEGGFWDRRGNLLEILIFNLLFYIW